MVLLSIHQSARGVRLCGAALALREASQTPLPPADHRTQQQALAATQVEPGATEFDAAWAMGTALTNLRQKAPLLQPGDEWRSDRARW
jgi:hypothetical protein